LIFLLSDLSFASFTGLSFPLRLPHVKVSQNLIIDHSLTRLPQLPLLGLWL
jgi:hypothetical protein